MKNALQNFFKGCLKFENNSVNLADKWLYHTSVDLQLLALDSKDFVKLKGLCEGGGGLLLDGDVLGVGGVDHAVRQLRLFIVIQRAAPGEGWVKLNQELYSLLKVKYLTKT